MDFGEIEKRADTTAGEIFQIHKKQIAGLSDEEENLLIYMAYPKLMMLLAEWNKPIDVGDEEG